MFQIQNDITGGGGIIGTDLKGIDSVSTDF